mgnify:CR=1 FL=1
MQGLEEEKKDEIPVVEMKIVMEVGKPMMVHFPALHDKIATYGFLKMAEKVIDAHYRQIDMQKLVVPKGGMMDFARRMK